MSKTLKIGDRVWTHDNDSSNAGRIKSIDAERQTRMLQELLAHDDEDLTAWAIDWLDLDLAACWERLEDDERDALVTAGVVEEVEGEVECTDAQDWHSDWRIESGAAWPSYTLEITADGMTAIEVDGWHIVGFMGPDGKRRHEEWDSDDSDGAENGLPRVDNWEICPGANMSGGGLIPCWRDDDGRWVTLDRDWLGSRGYGALAEAASQADHGSDPDWSDVPRDEMESTESRYIIQDYRVVEIPLVHGGIAERQEETYDRHDRSHVESTYGAEAWSHGLTDETWATSDEAAADLAERSQNEECYDDEADAKKALESIVDERLRELDELPGYIYDRDEEGLYVQQDTEGEDEDERYHLDEGETQRVCLAGWYAILPELQRAFGLRATLEAARDWRFEMDRIITERNPWVVLGDSVASGNCPAGSRAFAMELQAAVQADGDIGAVRASVILGLRDDVYTRRACRMAAQRTVVA